MTLETMQPFEQSFTVQQQHQDEEDRSDCSMFTTTPSPTVESDNYLLETFHQYPHGDFRPTFYNPFEIKHRRRTSRAQLKILEKSFSENPKPSATIRRILAQKLDMTPRGVQIWFQNRRAKAKLLRRKSSIQRQRQQSNQQQQSSDENEEDQEKYSNDSNSKKSEAQRSKKPSSSPATADISQSSVLFSQFFANVPTNQDVNEFNHFMSTMEDSQQQKPSNNNWSCQQQQQNHISNNVRTVATVAAAAAVATSSSPYEPSMLSIGGNSNWISHYNEGIFHQQSTRRRSCPVTKNTMLTSDMQYSNHPQQSAYSISPSWSHSMMPQSTKKLKESANFSSPMPLVNNNTFKRHFSYDSNSPSMDYNPMQNIHHLNNYAHHYYQQQLTPPLTASCSASTVAGSPISLDNLYNDHVVVPHHHNGYYSNSSHISSPLSTTTLVTGMIPNFV